MNRTYNADGSYFLTANAGMDLAILDESGGVIARVKEVQIPAAGTLNIWTEVAEELPQPTDSYTEKETRIAELKAELAKLENYKIQEENSK